MLIQIQRCFFFCGQLNFLPSVVVHTYELVVATWKLHSTQKNCSNTVQWNTYIICTTQLETWTWRPEHKLCCLFSKNMHSSTKDWGETANRTRVVNGASFTSFSSQRVQDWSVDGNKSNTNETYLTQLEYAGEFTRFHASSDMISGCRLTKLQSESFVLFQQSFNCHRWQSLCFSFLTALMSFQKRMSQINTPRVRFGQFRNLQQSFTWNSKNRPPGLDWVSFIIASCIELEEHTFGISNGSWCPDMRCPSTQFPPRFRTNCTAVRWITTTTRGSWMSNPDGIDSKHQLRKCGAWTKNVQPQSRVRKRNERPLHNFLSETSSAIAKQELCGLFIFFASENNSLLLQNCNPKFDPFNTGATCCTSATSKIHFSHTVWSSINICKTSIIFSSKWLPRSIHQ